MQTNKGRKTKAGAQSAGYLAFFLAARVEREIGAVAVFWSRFGHSWFGWSFDPCLCLLKAARWLWEGPAVKALALGPLACGGRLFTAQGHSPRAGAVPDAFSARVIRFILFILTAGAWGAGEEPHFTGRETGVSGNSGMGLGPGLPVSDRDRIWTPLLVFPDFCPR